MGGYPRGAGKRTSRRDNGSGLYHLTNAFTFRAGRKERDVSKNPNAGPVKCNALLAARQYSELYRRLFANAGSDQRFVGIAPFSFFKDAAHEIICQAPMTQQ